MEAMAGTDSAAVAAQAWSNEGAGAPDAAAIRVEIRPLRLRGGRR